MLITIQDALFLMCKSIYASREDKIHDVKDSFYEELEHVLDKYHMTAL
jgi:hypothetical protein